MIRLIRCGSTDNPWDVRIPIEAMWEQFVRVSKYNAAIILFAQLPFAAELIMSNPKIFRYEWIWEKSNRAGFLNAKKMPLRVHENILVFYRKLPTYNPQFLQGKPYKKLLHKIECNCYGEVKWDGKTERVNTDGKRYPIDILRFNSPIMGYDFKTKGVNTRDHSTQKPIDLLEYLIKTYSNEGELVLDACIGSGSTAVACINTGRHYVGFEMQPEFYNTAVKRIQEANSRGRNDN